nr:hypothetical protein [uncultured Desulfobulbus sp.]
MSSASDEHWHELFLHLQRAPLLAERRLCWPCPVGLPSSSMLHSLQHLSEQHNLHDLLARHLLSSLALAKHLQPELAQLPQSARAILSTYTNEQLQHIHWCCLPVLTRQGTDARILWMLLGRVSGGSGLHFIGDPQPATPCLQAVETVLEVMGSPGQVEHGYLALLLQHPAGPQLTGGSLALPLALGLRLLDQGKPWPLHVYASGCLAPGGQVTAVAGETDKYALVAGHVRLLLFPETGLPAREADPRIVRCSSLEQAEFSLDCLLEEGDPEKIYQYRACLANPRLFLDQLTALPLGLLHSSSGCEQFDRIRQDRHALLPVLARALSGCCDVPERAALLADTFSREEIDHIGRSDHEDAPAAHRWCVARIACANRMGAVGEGQQWVQLACALDAAMDVDKRVDFVNHAFVTTRFNRYRFLADSPPEFSRYLEIEQRRYEIDQRENRNLGAMYGTLAQNYAFCGSEFQQQFDVCIERAEAAFGRKYRREQLRLLAYRVYRQLDEGNTSQAAVSLNRYLNLADDRSPEEWIEVLPALWQRPTEHAPFQTALICRLLAEQTQAGSLQPKPGWCSALAAVVPKRLSHPWQLTAYNLGRLCIAAGLPGEGQTWLHRSAAACRGGGPTMLPMTLLPLAALYAATPGDTGLLASCGEIVAAMRRDCFLELAHFQMILDASSPRRVLELVSAESGRFFPFSYR